MQDLIKMVNNHSKEFRKEMEKNREENYIKEETGYMNKKKNKMELKNSYKPVKQKKYIGSKNKLVAIALASEIAVGTAIPAISKIVDNINKNNLKETIQNARLCEEYSKNISEDSKIISDDEVEKLEKLTSAVITFQNFKNKDNKTIIDEQNYMYALETINNSTDVVVNTYTDNIKEKIAKAYDIKNPEKIDNIEVTDQISFDGNNNIHNPTIEFDDVHISKNNIKGAKMSKELSDAIINARSLRDIDEYLPIEKGTVSEYEKRANKIIETFNDAQQFYRDYDFQIDSNGNINTKQIEKDNDER